MGVATSVCEPWSVVFDSVLLLGLAKQGTCVVFEISQHIGIATNVLRPRSVVRHQPLVGALKQ